MNSKIIPTTDKIEVGEALTPEEQEEVNEAFKEVTEQIEEGFVNYPQWQPDNS